MTTSRGGSRKRRVRRLRLGKLVLILGATVGAVVGAVDIFVSCAEHVRKEDQHHAGEVREQVAELASDLQVTGYTASMVHLLLGIVTSEYVPSDPETYFRGVLRQSDQLEKYANHIEAMENPPALVLGQVARIRGSLKGLTRFAHGAIDGIATGEITFEELKTSVPGVVAAFRVPVLMAAKRLFDSVQNAYGEEDLEKAGADPMFIYKWEAFADYVRSSSAIIRESVALRVAGKEEQALLKDREYAALRTSFESGRYNRR